MANNKQSLWLAIGLIAVICLTRMQHFGSAVYLPDATLAVLFASRTRAEWAAVASATDCCLEVVRTPDELASDPQHAARSALALDASGALALAPLGGPPREGHAPAHGEHTEAILADL